MSTALGSPGKPSGCRTNTPPKLKRVLRFLTSEIAVVAIRLFLSNPQLAARNSTWPVDRCPSVTRIAQPDTSMLDQVIVGAFAEHAVSTLP